MSLKLVTGNCKGGLLAAVLVAAAGLLLAGCASPARPELDHLTEEPVAEPFNGEYVATFHTRWFGPVYGRFTAQRTASGFKANTAPGVAWGLVGGIEQILGQMFAPFLFPSGMLMVWNSEDPDATRGAPAEGWIGPATVDPWRLPTTMTSVTGPVVIRYRDGRALGVMTFDRADKASLPSTDYAELNATLARVVRASYYDPAALREGALNSFFDDITTAQPLVKDDLTYLASLALAWRKHSSVAMPLPSRRPDPRTRELLAKVENSVDSLNLDVNQKSGVATLEAVVFEDPRAVDRFMDQVVSQNPPALVVDLRNCTGMDLSALRVASWLSSESLDAGTFVAASRRDLMKTEEQSPPPRAADAVVIESAADVEHAAETLDETGAIRLRLMPAERVYLGPVYVLTSSRTRSTGEVLAWLLQKSGRASVVGERTAARPRLSREHDLGQGFVVRVDEFDWLPPPREGASPHRAVAPDYSTTRQRAPARAAQLIADAAEKAESK